MVIDIHGNVYVTGSSQGLTSSYDYVTIKYDASGNQIWNARYDGLGNTYDEAKSIAVDSTGNVYVTGSSIGLNNNYDYATIKYDSSGNQLWVARYDGPGGLSHC
jgi:hypothetical protein